MSPRRERVRITVELDVASDPISGVLDDGAGSVVEFAGWLELMSALETASAATSPASPADPPQSWGGTP